jgi:hypothetical protein
MRGRLRGVLLAVRLLAAAALLVSAAGCSGQPHKEIEAIGVVASEDLATVGTDFIDTYTFDDGRTYTIRYSVNGGIQGNVRPARGDLVIAGSEPGYWMLAATPQNASSGCPEGTYGLGTQAGYDRETTIDLDFGVTLQKAPDFDPSSHVALAHFGNRGIICLDRQGRVTKLAA